MRLSIVIVIRRANIRLHKGEHCNHEYLGQSILQYMNVQVQREHHTDDTSAHAYLHDTGACVGVEQELSEDLRSTGEKRKWMEVNRTEGQDQERMERTLIQLNAGHPNGDRR